MVYHEMNEHLAAIIKMGAPIPIVQVFCIQCILKHFTNHCDFSAFRKRDQVHFDLKNEYHCVKPSTN